MSYITSALKRAQRANDERYLPYRQIIMARTRRGVRTKKRLILGISLVPLVLLASTAFALILYFGQEEPGWNDAALEPASVPHRARVDAGSRNQVGHLPDHSVPAADILFKAGLRRHQAGSLDEAEALYRRAIEADPKSLHALNNLGVLYMAKNRGQEAIDIFDRIIDLKGDWADPYYNLACIHSRQGNIPKSLWYLKVALWMNKELKELAKNDPDLEPLRSEPQYRKFVN